MPYDICEKIKKHIEESEKRQEIVNHEDIRHHLMIPILDTLGYNNCCMKTIIRNEKKTRLADSVDIAIDINHKNSLYVEIKNYNQKLDDKSNIEQLMRYMRSDAIRWGILTNGRRFILISGEIIKVKDIEDHIVMDIDFEKHNSLTIQKNNRYIKYFSRESIFENNTTKYYELIAQCKVYKQLKGKSWEAYKSTLYNFFDYISNKYTTYKRLESIEFNDFLGYWEHDSNSTDRSIETLKNQKTHIYSMFDCLHTNSNQEIRANTLKETECIWHKYLRDYKKKCSSNKKEKIIPIESIYKIIDVAKGMRYSTRNTGIVLLSVYTGRTCEEIADLKWDDINWKRNTISFGISKITIPPELKKLLLDLQKKVPNRKNKIEYIFSKEDQYKERMDTDSIVDLYSKMKQKGGLKGVSSQSITTFVIHNLFKNGYSVDEILALTGKELRNLEKYIPYDDIIRKINSNKQGLNKKHPFRDVLGL